MADPSTQESRDDSAAAKKPDEDGVNYYRDPDGNIIGPDVWISGRPYEGTPLRAPESEDEDAE